ncbi:MAG: 2-oxoacid:acceptor oxidoreductase subunit alpha [Bdellovibrionota bacterium]|nr:2-oxoacid:acceptor oxidoreductase subunit alpha [Bdellovibrionota bacterium]
MKDLDQVVIRFSGDSGDGMQLTGTQFSNTSAQMGNDLATFPDFPAEIRAPQGTVAGVSGFQIHFGAVEISTPGDEPDVLVAMNPAALKANITDVKKGGTIIINEDAFNDLGYKKAGYAEEPITKLEKEYRVINAKITSQTKEALAEVELDSKSKARCKNFYALGMTYFMFSRDLKPTLEWIQIKFGHNKILSEANAMALKAGYHFADTIEASGESYKINPATIEKGIYRQISGNTALAWGFMYAAENSGLDLFLGSYPITPASDILHELAAHKNFNIKTFQAEDEIAAMSSAVGAAYAGALALTTSSGPGIALKSEALNLAMMLELPLVVVDVQRGGPSTGLPTKTEQSDLNMALYGRNGESPIIVLAAKSPSDCFKMAFEASRLAIEHMTPVMLLTDGYIANGSTPWRLPDLDKDFPQIKVNKAEPQENFLPYKRNPENLVRQWAIPGTENLMHRVGGLEKENDTGNVSYDPANHELMVTLREEKINKVALNIPDQKVTGNPNAKRCLVSWGGTYGSVSKAVENLNKDGIEMAHIHIKYLNPLPKNLESLLRGFEEITVCELNRGQLAGYLNSKFSLNVKKYNKVQGKPFKEREIYQLMGDL